MCQLNTPVTLPKPMHARTHLFSVTRWLKKTFFFVARDSEPAFRVNVRSCRSHIYNDNNKARWFTVTHQAEIDTLLGINESNERWVKCNPVWQHRPPPT